MFGRSGYIRSDAGAFQNRSALLSSELSRTDLADDFCANTILVPFESAFKGLSNDTKIRSEDVDHLELWPVFVDIVILGNRGFCDLGALFPRFHWVFLQKTAFSVVSNIDA